MHHTLTPEEIMIKSRIKLLKICPFFGTLAMSSVVNPSEAVPTLGTNGEAVWYNPDFVAEQYKKHGLDYTMAAFAHEMGHKHLLHHLRQGERNPALFNMAGDYVINLILQDSGFKIGEGWLLDEKYRGMSTEQVYEKLKKDFEQPPSAGGGCDGQGQCVEAPKGSGPDGALTEDDIAVKEAQARQQIAQAAQVARLQGNLPAGLEAEIEAILNPPERWQDILREFITHITQDDYSWSRGRRQHLGRGFYLPSLHSERMGEMVVAVDTSGSCVHEFADFMNNLNSIIEDCRPEKVTMLHVDAGISHAAEYDNEDLPLPMTLHGGGGTSFRPPFEYVDRHGIEPVCLVYFTDTYGDFPEDEPDYPVLWACTIDQPEVPFGRAITIDTREAA